MAFEIYRDNPTPVGMPLLDRRLSDSPTLFWDDDEFSSDSGLGSPLSDLEHLLLSADTTRRSRRIVRSRRRLFTNKRQREESCGGNTSEEEELVSRKRRRCHSPLTSTFNPQPRETSEMSYGNLHDCDDFIGDGTCVHALPVLKGLDDGIQRVHNSTIADVLAGEYKDIEEFQMIDCRYPYEFQGGHIEGAVNIYTEEGVDAFLQDIKTQNSNNVGKRVIVLYSESSERGLKLLKLLRSADRKLNSDRYPELFYPEIYLLHGGYSTFYLHHKRFCFPREHVHMFDPRHCKELRHFRSNEQRKIKSMKRERNEKIQYLFESPLF